MSSYKSQESLLYCSLQAYSLQGNKCYQVGIFLLTSQQMHSYVYRQKMCYIQNQDHIICCSAIYFMHLKY